MMDSRYFLSRDITAALPSGGQFPWQNDRAICESGQPSNAWSRTSRTVSKTVVQAGGGAGFDADPF